MAVLNHGRFFEELAHLARSHPTESELLLVRSALMWMSVSQRPLRAHELWIALQIGESKDIEHLERLLSESAYADERKAVSLLQNLLGGLISTNPGSKNPNRVYVTLCDPDLCTFLNRMDEPDIPEPIMCLAFSTAQAHILAASICMVICSLTTLRLAHVHDDTIASSLVLYAWTHWNAHLSLSGYTLGDDSVAGLAEPMIYAVCTDLLVFLLALNDFVTGPIAFPATNDRARCIALIKEVHLALAKDLGQIQLVEALVERRKYCKTMQTARTIFEASSKTGGLPETTATTASATSANSKVETLPIDRLLKRTWHLFDGSAGGLVLCFADLARGLRSLSMLLAHTPLYEELLKEYSTGWSPLDILVNVANWMEAVASYPYWGGLFTADSSSNPLIIRDTSDPNYDTALFVLSRLRMDGTSQSNMNSNSANAQVATKASEIHPRFGVSPLRWNAARLVYKLKGIRTRRMPGATFTINDRHKIRARTSPFVSLPIGMAGSPWAAYLSNSFDKLYNRLGPLMPRSLHHLQMRYLNPVVAYLPISSVITSVDGFAAAAISGGQADNWPKLKTALLIDGYRAAFNLFLVAVVLNHIRSILLPWFGQWMWYTPLEDLRLARSNPDVFLETSLSYRWGWLVFMYVQGWVYRAVGTWLIAVVTGEGAQRVPRAMLNAAANDDPSTRGTGRPAAAVLVWLERFMAAVKVLYIAWMLGSVEYIISRWLNTVAWLMAYYKLLAGGDAEYIALENVLKVNWIKVPLTVWQLADYLKNVIWPLSWASLWYAVIGQPELLMVMLGLTGVVTAVIKYRSTFYIALEISGMFVVIGFVLLTIILMGLEFFDDPLGLKLSTSLALTTGARARNVLPQGAGSRTQILRGKAALPVRRSLPPLPPLVSQAASARSRREAVINVGKEE
ncbi:hypothetical protein MMYC01_201657 [Madurella mycetomatis]|uniref:Uncharacterized protein n=1 Tax=Madurella mycetomatis TaxID=100816 RepID=A0A175WFI3_9PEZI|nr:hypothetical protein MMYC01_201657 [Madurella mycetomatis]